jgi:AAA+ superfamily predicted ATPase
MSTAEILEQALRERFGREMESTMPPIRTDEEIRAWLDELAALSDRIPAKPGETFSREMIYEDHA